MVPFDIVWLVNHTKSDTTRGVCKQEKQLFNAVHKYKQHYFFDHVMRQEGIQRGMVKGMAKRMVEGKTRKRRWGTWRVKIWSERYNADMSGDRQYSRCSEKRWHDDDDVRLPLTIVCTPRQATTMDDCVAQFTPGSDTSDASITPQTSASLKMLLSHIANNHERNADHITSTGA